MTWLLVVVAVAVVVFVLVLNRCPGFLYILLELNIVGNVLRF